MTAAVPAATSPPPDLAGLVAKCLNEPIASLSRLAGGLSPRQFYRMRRASGEAAIVMWLPPDAPEMALARRLGRRLPFLEMRDILENARVRVPALFGAAPEQGVIVVEDLGETLADAIVRDPSLRPALYRRAVRDLAAAQVTLNDLPSDCIARIRGFDRELLTWEIEHFREWGVAALGIALSAAELSMFERATSWLVESILSFPQGFVHRDYQSRNLLALPGGAVGWIDFQDALWGPRAYDLVALLRDSYQTFDEGFISERLAEFVAARGLAQAELTQLRFELDVITVQRKLKDAGRFVFFERTRADASYLQFFVPTLELVRGALSRLPARPELLGLNELVTRQVEIGRERGMLPA